MTTIDETTSLLEEMRIRTQISDAVIRYARGCDRGDRDAVLSAFHPGADIDYTVFRGNPEEFCAWVLPMLLNHYTWTTHQNTNHLIEFDTDHTRAVGEVYVTATMRFEKDGELYELRGVGRYFDVYEPRNGQWLMVSRRCISDTSYTSRVPVENESELAASVGSPGTRDKNDMSYGYFAKVAH